jgi:hypothetical protein
MKLASLDAGHYRIPLPVVVSDSTHGEITHFEWRLHYEATAPDRPGHGVVFDWGALDELRVPE